MAPSSAHTPPLPICLAMTGASGAPYAVRLLQVLCRSGHTVHLTISDSGAQVLRAELGDMDRFERIDQVVAYAGLDIEVKESGKWKGQAMLSKRGSGRRRRILYCHEGHRDGLSEHPGFRKLDEAGLVSCYQEDRPFLTATGVRLGSAEELAVAERGVRTIAHTTTQRPEVAKTAPAAPKRAAGGGKARQTRRRT